MSTGGLSCPGIFFNYFFSVLKSSLCIYCSHFLGQFILDIFRGYFEWHSFLNFFLSVFVICIWEDYCIFYALILYLATLLFYVSVLGDFWWSFSCPLLCGIISCTNKILNFFSFIRSFCFLHSPYWLAKTSGLC